ncbi:MAG TPA: GNAT family N-acetyltransferase [Anaerolineaceae bacterium]|nr:GNAT family N-acetyltransferase [Anaerolineaceae bacterium]
MQTTSIDPATLTFRPLTPETWDDFEELFRQPGDQNGCWCVFWRVTRREFQEHFGEGNRQLMQALVAMGRVPGILAYHAGQVVGWCSVAPRAEFHSLNRSRTLKPIDEQPVWSITCFVVSKPHRGQGMTRALIAAAVDHARRGGAKIVEAYPLTAVPLNSPFLEGELYMGVMDTYLSLGFREAARRSERRAILRLEIGEE